MKLIALSALVLCLTFAKTAQAQQEGPLMRAVHRDAGRLATLEAQPPDAESSPGWSELAKLERGTKILVDVRGHSAASRRFLWADDSELIVLRVDHLPGEVRRGVLEMVAKDPAFFRVVLGRSIFVYEKVRVEPGGVFLVERKIAETSEVVLRIPRSEIALITTPLQRRGSVVGAAAGLGAGLLIGYRLALGFMLKPCGAGGCGNEQAFAALSIVGIPIAGAALGYQARTQTTQEVIYRNRISSISTDRP